MNIWSVIDNHLMKTLHVSDLGKLKHRLEWLHLHCFPSDQMPDWSIGSWWITWDENRPVAFIGVEEVASYPKCLYISRVGVVASKRGQGLQSFLMNKVVKGAKLTGYTTVISTTYENPASANNFIRCKFKTYTPQSAWGAPGTIYWIKSL